MVSEELCRANAVLVYHIPDFGKYLIQREGGCFLQGMGGRLGGKEGKESAHEGGAYIRQVKFALCVHIKSSQIIVQSKSRLAV